MLNGRQSLEDLLKKGDRVPTNRPVTMVDAALRRGIQAIALLVLTVIPVWIAIGDDRGGVTNQIWLIPAGALALGAIGLTGVTIGSCIGVVKQVARTGGNRPGRLRAAGVLVAVLVATGGGGGLMGVRVADAIREQRDIDDRNEARQRSETKAAEAQTGLSADQRLNLYDPDVLASAKAGTCFDWPEGPTAAQPLDNLADPARIVWRDCATAHSYEVIGTVDAGLGLADPYPGGRRLATAALPKCGPLLLDYLTAPGKPRPAATAWGSYAIAPSRERWSAFAARRVSCVATPPKTGVTRAGSLAHAG